MVNEHKKAVHPRMKATDVPKTRPLRIAARRQRELMAIIASGTFNNVDTTNYISVTCSVLIDIFTCTSWYHVHY